MSSSTLNINNYEQHRPHSSIIQNLEVVPEASITRKALVLIGSSDNQVPVEYQNKGLIYIDSPTSAFNKLVGEGNVVSSNNILYQAAIVALAAGNNYAFYALPAEDSASFMRIQITTTQNGATTSINYGTVTSSEFTCSDTSTADITYTLDGQNSPVTKNFTTSTSTTTITCGSTDTEGTIVDNSEQSSSGTVVTYQVSNVTASTWDTAPKILANSDKSLVVVPLTYDLDNQQALAQVVATLSTEDNQKWKRMYRPAYADPVNSTDATITSTATQIAEKIQTDNLFVTGGALTTEQRCITIWTAGATQASYNETDNTTTVTTMSNILVAAGIGALRASLLPQQGLSMKELDWIYSIPNSYLLFDRDDLNEIAVAGTFIIMQEDEDSTPFVRHQLTNDLSQGILYYEDSVGVNVDMICYGVKDIVKPYLGQRNNTNATLVEIRNKVTDYLIGLTNVGTDNTLRQIGPQIKSVDLESVVVKIDSNYKDRVIISFDIEIPLPINTIKVHINAFADLSIVTA